MSGPYILNAVLNVAEGREERVAIPGVWRVYQDDGLVWLEVYPAQPVVMTTRIDRRSDD